MIKEVCNKLNEKFKISIEELLSSSDDICVIIPRPTLYFAMWIFDFDKEKYSNELLTIRKHIELQKKYYYVKQKKDGISDYILPLDDARLIIDSIKIKSTLRSVNIVNISKNEFFEFENSINEEFYKLERIRALKSKKYLTIKEKKELVLYGEQVPICVEDSSKKSICSVVPPCSIYQNKIINLDDDKSLVKKITRR